MYVCDVCESLFFTIVTNLLQDNEQYRVSIPECFFIGCVGDF